MEHVSGWCFRGIYKGGLWEDDLHVSALISSDYWHDTRGNYRQLAPLKLRHKSHEGQTSDIKAFRAITRVTKDVQICCYNYVRQA